MVGEGEKMGQASELFYPDLPLLGPVQPPVSLFKQNKLSSEHFVSKTLREH